MNNILIVENNALTAMELKQTVEDLGYKVMGIADQIEPALNHIKQSKPDLVLVDIELNNGDSGISLGALLNSMKIPFIYVTSFFDGNTLTQVKHTNPLAYITKPFKESDLKANLILAAGKIEHLTGKETHASIVEDKVFLKDKGDIISISKEDLLYLKGEDNYTNVITREDRFMVSQSLGKLEKKLVNMGFIRIHKSYIVNLSKVKSISGNILYVEGGSIPIGKTFKRQLMESLPLI